MGQSTPFQRITVSEANPVPVTVRVKSGPPATVLSGEMLVREGNTALTGMATELDRPPPGAGLKTVILPVPALETRS